MEWTQDHKHSARGRFSTILRFFEGIFQKKIFHSMIMSNLALLDMLKHDNSSDSADYFACQKNVK